MEENTLINKEAEEYTIGCLLLYPDTAMTMLINNECGSDWFYFVNHQAIWEICLKLHDEKKPIDIMTVQDLATKQKKHGLSESIHTCSETAMTITHLEYYLDIVKDLAHKRKQKEIMQKHMADLPGEKSAVEISSSLRFEIQNIKYEKKSEKTQDEVLKEIRARYNNGNEKGFIGIPSRWLSLQRKLGGYKKGKVCLLAARPSKGKTTIACNEARYMAEQGYKVGIISLETDEEEIYETMAADKSGIDLFKMSNGDLEPGGLHKLDEAVQAVIKLPIYVSDRSMDIRHVVNWIHFMSSKKKLDVIFIDYIQIIADCPSLNFKSMREKISYYSKQIFQATRDTGVATVLLSQIGRGGEVPPNVKANERWRFTPKLHHLKESGALEEDAYQAILLYDDPDEGNTKGRLSINFIFDVAKNKKGPTGHIKMVYIKNMQRVEDVIGNYKG